MTVDGNDLGGRLRAARRVAGMSQADVARGSGIPKPRISQYENGHIRPSVTSLGRLAAAIGVSKASLLDARTGAETALLTELRRLKVRVRSVPEALALASEIASSHARRARRTRRT